MGKYMKKSKVTGDVVNVMEPPKTTLGVCTRARTQRLLNSSSSSVSSSSSLCYLQLRSRRLQKPAFLVLAGPKPKKKKEEEEEEKEEREEREVLGFSVEEFCGDNCFDSQLPRDRSSRESTPCSLLRDSEAIRTPGSTTRKTSSTSANRKVGIDTHRNIPTTDEMEEFFSLAEREQHRLFMEKYNFDVVNDLPLPGRYEWFQVVQ